jgi:hypothetical protein
MAITTYTVRQVSPIAAEEFPTPPTITGTVVISGSTSNLYVNINRTNLDGDPGTGRSGEYRWVNGPALQGGPAPGPYGVIIGGNDSWLTTGADGAATNISCWGWPAGEDQPTNDTEFIALTQYLQRTFSGTVTVNSTASAKTYLQAQGFYYQYPVGFQGQSPSTGTGSDS